MLKAPLARALSGVIIGFLLAACGSAEKTQTPVRLETPPAGQLPAGVTPTVYRLTLETDPAADTFSGTVEIDVTLDAPHDRIWLHALGQDITSAVARAGTSEIPATFTGDQAEGGVARLDFAAPLPAGQATLVIDYVASYNLGLAGLYKATQADKPYLATQMQAIDARRMVPSFDEPRFKTTWVFTVTAPAGNKVISNGALITETPLEDGRITHSFQPTRPLPSYLVALLVGPYDESEQTWIASNMGRPAPIPLRGFAAAGKGAKLADALVITDEMLLWQEEYFGQPYAYGKLDLIAVPDFAYGAMENAGAIVYREAALLIDERTALAQRRGIFSTHAHELAHQWFGNLVTPAWWDDIWLNEAFATWMANKTMVAVEPEGEWETNLISAGLAAMSADSLKNARQIRNPIASNGDINGAFDAITYSKGGSVLNMFETYLGPDRFREGVRVHMRKFFDGVANVDDFMASLAEGSGDTAVTESFRTFILQSGIPMLDVQVSCPDPQNGLIEITQSRYAPLGSDIDRNGQTWQVPFTARVSGPGGETIVRQMLTGKVSTIPVPGTCPDWVMPNAGGGGYWRFATDERNAANLAAAFTSLTPGEQLVYLDGLVAGFRAGAVPAAQLLEGLRLSASGSVEAVGLPFGALRGYHARLDAAGKANLSAWIEATYAARAAALDARPARSLSPREQLLKQSLSSLLTDIGNRPAARAALVRKAEAYIGSGTVRDTAALQPEELGAAMDIAVSDAGAPFADAALAFALASENQSERSAILRAIATRGTPETVSALVGKAATLPLTGAEIYSVIAGAISNEGAYDAAWPVFESQYDTLLGKLPEVRKAQSASLAGSACSTSRAARAKAFFESKAALIPGYERPLALGLESAALCAAFVEQRLPELASALSAP